MLFVQSILLCFFAMLEIFTKKNLLYLYSSFAVNLFLTVFVLTNDFRCIIMCDMLI